MIVGAGQGFPARMDPTGGGGAKKFFLKISGKFVGNGQKMPETPYFSMLQKNLWGGVDKR